MSLCSGNKVFGCAGKAAPKGGLSSLSLLQGLGPGKSNRGKSFILPRLRVGSCAESKGLSCVSGTWTKAAAECVCHWGDWVALGGPSALPLLLSGDSRAEGSNPHGPCGLSAGLREHLHPRAVTPHPPGSAGIVSLCPSGGSGAEELLGFGSCQSQALLTPCTPAGLGVWGQLCPLHVLLSCASLWQECGLGCAPAQGCPAPGELSPSHCCPRRQGRGFSARSPREKWGCKDSWYC